jgi:hypothetical protein
MESALSGLLRPLIDQELSIVFYDLTTIRTEGGTEQTGEVRQFGLSKDGGIVRQVMLGVVQTAEGLPIHHEVFAGNSGETTTLVPTIEKVLARYPIKRVVLVADRGLLSLDNLEAIRRFGWAVSHWNSFWPSRPAATRTSIPAGRIPSAALPVGDRRGRRGIGMARLSSDRGASPRHRQRTGGRRGMSASRRWRPTRQGWAGKLDGQDSGQTHRGRKLSDAGTTARFYRLSRRPTWRTSSRSIWRRRYSPTRSTSGP